MILYAKKSLTEEETYNYYQKYLSLKSGLATSDDKLNDLYNNIE